jgi:hypothetical protein
MAIDMIMNIRKYDTNKRWVIHNLCYQKVSNLWFFETFHLRKEGNLHSISKDLIPKWFTDVKIDENLMEHVQIVKDTKSHKNKG